MYNNREMNDLKVIGHRGVRGPYTENSLAAFAAASKTKADAIEFDVQCTEDGELVVLHAMSSPRKVFGITQKINDLTWPELQKYRSKDDERVPMFDEVMSAIKGKPVMIDVKDVPSAGPLAKKLRGVGAGKVALINSLYPEALLTIQNICPNIPLVLHTYKHPLRAIRQAKEMNFFGVALVLYLLNPITYLAARRAGLKICTYQNYASFLLTWRWFVKLIRLLYPSIVIISDRPDKIAGKS